MKTFVVEASGGVRGDGDGGGGGQGVMGGGGGMLLGEAAEAVVEAVGGPLGVGGLGLNLLKNVFSSFARPSFPAAPPLLLWKPVIFLHPTPDVPGVVVVQFVLQFSSEVVLALNSYQNVIYVCMYVIDVPKCITYWMFKFPSGLIKYTMYLSIYLLFKGHYIME